MECMHVIESAQIITYDLDKALLGGVGAKLRSKHPNAVLREKIG